LWSPAASARRPGPANLRSSQWSRRARALASEGQRWIIPSILCYSRGFV
jgi:hypothetical protein